MRTEVELKTLADSPPLKYNQTKEHRIGRCNVNNDRGQCHTEIKHMPPFAFYTLCFKKSSPIWLSRYQCQMKTNWN